MNIKKILVLNDLKPKAKDALKFALNLKDKFNSDLFVLFVDEFFLSYKSKNLQELDRDKVPYFDDLMTIKQEILQTYFNKISKQIKKTGYEKSDINIVISEGKASENTINLTKHEKIDLLIIGANKPKGLKNFFRSATVEKIMKKTDIPVMIVRSGSTKYYGFQAKKILFPTDFSSHSKYAMEMVKNFAAVYKAQVTLLNVETEVKIPKNGPSKKYLNFKRHYKNCLSEDFAKCDVSPGKIIEELHENQIFVEYKQIQGKPAATISKYAMENGYDLIIMSASGAGGTKDGFLGSVAELTFKKSFVPVLIVK
ncbi:MAG: universal stress protein [Pseudomonadota bacterium]